MTKRQREHDETAAELRKNGGKDVPLHEDTNDAADRADRKRDNEAAFEERARRGDTQPGERADHDNNDRPMQPGVAVDEGVDPTSGLPIVNTPRVMDLDRIDTPSEGPKRVSDKDNPTYPVPQVSDDVKAAIGALMMSKQLQTVRVEDKHRDLFVGDGALFMVHVAGTAQGVEFTVGKKGSESPRAPSHRISNPAGMPS